MLRVYNITFRHDNNLHPVRIYDNGKKVYEGCSFGCFLLGNGLNQREIEEYYESGNETVYILKPEKKKQQL